ncbi:MAG: hypothetical protein U0931_14240 [Vulcanimicrobiota bacterium]
MTINALSSQSELKTTRTLHSSSPTTSQTAVLSASSAGPDSVSTSAESGSKAAASPMVEGLTGNYGKAAKGGCDPNHRESCGWRVSQEEIDEMRRRPGFPGLGIRRPSSQPACDFLRPQGTGTPEDLLRGALHRRCQADAPAYK